jgi:hypothetical protein
MPSSLQAARSTAVTRRKAEAESKEPEMKRNQLMNATSAGRGLQVLVTSAMLFAVPAVILAGGMESTGHLTVSGAGRAERLA